MKPLRRARSGQAFPNFLSKRQKLGVGKGLFLIDFFCNYVNILNQNNLPSTPLFKGDWRDYEEVF